MPQKALEGGAGRQNSLEKQWESGIIKTNMPKEIPDVGKTLIRTDATGEYLKAAVPGEGTVKTETGYMAKTHQSEIKMADWLHCTFGGDILLLKESKDQGDKTPDYHWNGRDWELKGVSSKNSVDRAVREAAKQIGAYPGGIILEASESGLSLDEIENAAGDRIRRTALNSVDIIIVSKGKLKKIVRYEK